jgi:hypothetical protein
LVVVGSALELDAQPVVGWALGTALVPGHHDPTRLLLALNSSGSGLPRSETTQ